MLAPAATFVASNGYTYRCAFPARHPAFFVPCQDCHPEPPPALRPAPRRLTAEDRLLLAHDLRTVADVYDADAQTADTAPNCARMAATFRQQAARSRAYADLFEDLDTPITIEGDTDAA